MFAAALGYFLTFFLFVWGLIFTAVVFHHKSSDNTRAICLVLAVISFAFSVGAAKWVS